MRSFLIMLIPNILITTVVIFTIATPIFRLEPWPFSSYQMFSQDFRVVESDLEIIGYTSSGKSLRLNTDKNFTQPFYLKSLKMLLWRTIKIDPTFARSRRALKFLLTKYEERRYLHQGPQLTRVVLRFKNADLAGSLEVTL